MFRIAPFGVCVVALQIPLQVYTPVPSAIVERYSNDPEKSECSREVPPDFEKRRLGSLRVSEFFNDAAFLFG